MKWEKYIQIKTPNIITNKIYTMADVMQSFKFAICDFLNKNLSQYN